MELFTPPFFSALLAIVVIDLVLAGDNAIVIALAARNLAAHLRKAAIIWGTVGAIAVRSSLTFLVVWLLAIPGLSFGGGAVLIWIAYKLLLPEREDENGIKVPAVRGFWRAIGTIVFADIVMGLDNVLGVAGAAHGSYALVVLGLLISIPIVVWGSTLILRIIERFPAFVYLGAGVLAWTAAKMMSGEPLLAPFYADHKVVVPVMHTVIVLGVLWAGFVKNHRRWESSISALLARFARRPDGSLLNLSQDDGGNIMFKVLVPIDGSPNSIHAVRRVINHFMKDAAMEVHLLNIQPPLSAHVARFVSKRNRSDFHRDQAARALHPCVAMLESFGVPHAVHVEVGAKAKLITEAARRLHCDQIVMSTARKNSLTRMIEDSTTNKVLESTSVPVEVIAGDAVSRLERYGVPMGIGAMLALIFLAAE